MGRWLLALTVLCSVGVAHGSEEEDEEATDVREIEVLDQETLDRAELLFFSGLEHYRKRRFEEAAVDFQKAFSLTRHRDLLFNVARSREQLNDKGGAVEWYRAYLATRPADETAIIHRIGLLGGDPTPAKPSEIEGKVVAVPKVEVVEEGPGVLPWISLGVGVAAVATGVVFGFQALDEAALARSAERRAPASRYRDQAERSALLADVSFGVAALGVAGAIWLWLDSDRAAAGAAQVQVGGVPGGGGLVWSGSF